MNLIQDQTIDQLLNLHHSLWDNLDSVNYFGVDYQIDRPYDSSYAQVLVPGKQGSDILVATNDLNITNYGTMAIERAAKRGRIVRITWIKEVQQSEHHLIGLIKTTPEHTLIERYTQYGTEVLYSTDPYHQSIKSEY